MWVKVEIELDPRNSNSSQNLDWKIEYNPQLYDVAT